MPTLRLSENLTNRMVNNSTAGALFNTAGGSAQASIIAGSTNAGVSLLQIYKGTPASFPSFTDRSTRSSDLLITFTLPNALGSYVDEQGFVNQAARYTIGKHLANQAASASGIASWFLLCRSGTTSLTDKGAMIGTVGLLGSDSDLEIPDTNIVSGNNYQCAGFFLNVPQNWVF